MSENLGPSTQKGKPKYDLVTPLVEQRNLPTVRPMSEAESAMLQGLTQPIRLPERVIHDAPGANHSGHVRENFDVRAMAQVARTFGKDDALIVGGITLVLTIGIYWFVPGDVVLYGLGWLIIWGTISLFAMNRTRLQAYNHSPIGVARLETTNDVLKHARAMDTEDRRIDTAADVAIKVAKIHADLMRDRWLIESGKDIDQ